MVNSGMRSELALPLASGESARMMRSARAGSASPPPTRTRYGAAFSVSLRRRAPSAISTCATALGIPIRLVDVPKLTANTRLLLAGPSAIASVAAAFAKERDLAWADQVTCIASRPRTGSSRFSLRRCSAPSPPYSSPRRSRSRRALTSIIGSLPTTQTRPIAPSSRAAYLGRDRFWSATVSFPKRPDYVVIKESWPAAKFTMQSSDDTVILSTSLLKITITRKDGAITYSEASGGSLVQEASRKHDSRESKRRKYLSRRIHHHIYGSQEAFYGLGQHQAGVWNYRGESVDISQDNTNIAVPLLVSSNGYGIFWNNASRSRFNNRFVHSLYISSEVADTIDYYFLYGPDFDKIVAGYRELTGAAPMFGKWAYGFWQCKNKYQSQDENPGRGAQISRAAHPRR